MDDNIKDLLGEVAKIVDNAGVEIGDQQNDEQKMEETERQLEKAALQSAQGHNSVTVLFRRHGKTDLLATLREPSIRAMEEVLMFGLCLHPTGAYIVTADGRESIVVRLDGAAFLTGDNNELSMFAAAYLSAANPEVSSSWGANLFLRLFLLGHFLVPSDTLRVTLLKQTL